MKTALLYSLTLLIGIYMTWSGASRAFWGVPVSLWPVASLVGTVLVGAGGIIRGFYATGRGRQSTLAGGFILLVCWAAAAISLVFHYVRGDVVASVLQIGIRLLLGIPILVLLISTKRSSDIGMTRKLAHRAALSIAGTLAALLLGSLGYISFARATQYDIPGGFTGWLTVKWDNPRCPALRREGIFRVVRFSSSGQACTSTPQWSDLTYLRFVYTYRDGTQTPLNWNRHGKSGVQAWLLGYDLQDKVEYIFVGDEEAMNHSGPEPSRNRAASKSDAPQSH